MRKLLFWLARLAARLASAVYQGEGVSTLFLMLPTQLATELLQTYGASIGRNVRFRTPLIIHNAAVGHGKSYFHNLDVGDGCYFGKDVFLDLQEKIIVEARATISMRVTILTHTDVGNSRLALSFMPPTQAPVIIRQDAYIGAGAMIMQGVEIGAASIVGAGAVVTHSIPPYSIAVGVPARVVRSLDPEILSKA